MELVYGSFHQADKLIQDKDTTYQVQFDSADEMMTQHMIPLSDNKFALTFIDKADGKLKTEFMKNGIRESVIGPYGASQNMKMKSVHTCKYPSSDTFLVVATVQLFDANGTQIGSDGIHAFKASESGIATALGTTIFGEKQSQNAKCGHISGDDFWVTWETGTKLPSGRDILLNYINAHIGGGTEMTSYDELTKKTINDYEPDDQRHPSIVTLKGPNSGKNMLAFAGFQVASAGTESAIMFNIIEKGAAKYKTTTANNIVPGTDGSQVVCNWPVMHAMDDGGYILVYEKFDGAVSNSSEIIFERWTNNINSQERTCSLKINTVADAFWPAVDVYDNVAYVIYRDGQNAVSNIIGVLVNPDDCVVDAEHGEQTIFATNGNGMPQVSISKQSSEAITKFVSFQHESTNQLLKISEFMVKQIVQCIDLKYTGCYGVSVGSQPICNGNSWQARVARTKVLFDFSNGTRADCDCSDKYFHIDGDIDCHACDYQCATCETESDNCLTCIGSMASNNRENPGNCNCKPRFFEDGADDCSPCDAPCYRCEVVSSNCTVCPADDFNAPPTRDIPTCQCKDKMFDIAQNDCYMCDPQCASCSLQKDNCTSCVDPHVRDINLDCECSLDSTSVIQPDGSAICVRCKERCTLCSGAPDNCQDCTHLSRDFTKSCACRDGFYESGVDACFTSCDFQCNGCAMQMSSCLACSSKRINPPQCNECEDGYYHVALDQPCEKCTDKCETCTDPYLCKTCKDGDMLPPNCLKTKIGYFSELSPSGNYIDKKCHPKCLICEETQSNCRSCQGANRAQNPPDCTCKKGFFLVNPLDIDCLPCPFGCVSCESIDKCTECTENRQLDGSNKCACKDGFQEIDGQCSKQCGKDEFRNDQQKCQKCYFYKDTVCLSICPLNTYQNEVSFMCEEDNKNYSKDLINLAIIILVVLFLFFTIHKIVDSYSQRQKAIKFAHDFRQRNEQFRQAKMVDDEDQSDYDNKSQTSNNLSGMIEPGQNQQTQEWLGLDRSPTSNLPLKDGESDENKSPIRRQRSQKRQSKFKFNNVLTDKEGTSDAEMLGGQQDHNNSGSGTDVASSNRLMFRQPSSSPMKRRRMKSINSGHSGQDYSDRISASGDNSSNGMGSQNNLSRDDIELNRVEIEQNPSQFEQQQQNRQAQHKPSLLIDQL